MKCSTPSMQQQLHPYIIYATRKTMVISRNVIQLNNEFELSFSILIQCISKLTQFEI
jgi:hypothetical protein